MLICGLGDGGVYAIKPQTGEKIWGTVIAKRGINTGVVVNGSTVIVSHGDENLDTSEMGMVAAIDGSQKGEIKTTKWAAKGFLAGFSSPIIDGDRVLQIENGARLTAFDIVTGKQLWKQQLGTVQKAPPVLADGKIYVGTETGKFFILKPHNDRCEVLSEVEMPESKDSAGGSQGTPEQILAGAAVSRGRVFFVSSDAVYAIGARRATAPTGFAVDDPVEKGEGSPAWVQVTPTELVLKPGQTVKLHARLYDEKGRFLREEKARVVARWIKGNGERWNANRRQ
jgi:outer membrane protein assembly factor BamB